MEGHILSVESMGLVDGPGIRTVVFFQGCALRCRFCHNPDTWTFGEGQVCDSEELIARIKRFKPYFQRSGGGVTFSGGEPLMQPEFLTELLRRCKEEGIHTCLDTAGVGRGDYDEILSYTDLVLYDVKAVSADAYSDLCAGALEAVGAFEAALAKSGCPAVIRAVVIPGVNDTDGYMLELKKYIEKNIPTAVGVELLPYHKLGTHKYTAKGLCDPLESVPPMEKERARALWETHFKDFKN